jgi:murein DD-endopeptidase MepM/ murein hydrolase activator NlpD
MNQIRRFFFFLRRVWRFALHVLASLAAFKKPIFRARYFKTKTGRLRLRYIACALVALFSLTFTLEFSDADPSSFYTAKNSPHKTERQQDAAPQLVVNIPNVPQGADTPTQKSEHNEPGLIGGLIESLGMAEGNTVKPEQGKVSKTLHETEPAAKQAAVILPQRSVVPVPRQNVRPENWSQEIFLKKGGTLSGALGDASVPSGDAFAAIKALSEKIDVTSLRPEQPIYLHFRRVDNSLVRFVGLDIRKNGIETVRVRRDAEQTSDSVVFKADIEKQDIIEETRAARVTVSSSIFADLGKADVPDGIINQMIKAYSWSVDFQRDIWGGEEIEVLYTITRNEDESYLRSGQLLYANLKLRGKDQPIYYFTKKDGQADFFFPSGNSVRKALLQTPVDGARVSSGYGLRRHPVLGYSKMHKGVDFAAPTGTPIYAAGDGIIERADWFSSYGKYVRIRHNDKYKTAYAHMHKINVKKGQRVKQGQKIGSVGTTGRSTGPHLHYEVIVNGKQVNPRSVKLPIGDKLSGTNLANLKNRIDAHDKKFKSIIASQMNAIPVAAGEEG